MKPINNNPIVIIEDDVDDQYIFQRVFNELGYVNEVMFFQDGADALAVLEKGDVIPFLILSDIKMPKLDGFALREKLKMDRRLEMRCIPYIYFTSKTNNKAVVDAYSVSAQGFFVKDTDFNELVNTIGIIMKYWQSCVAPNHFGPEV